MGPQLADDSAQMRCPLSPCQEPNLLAGVEPNSLSFLPAEDLKGEKPHAEQGEGGGSRAPVARALAIPRAGSFADETGEALPPVPNPPLTIAAGRLTVVTPVPGATASGGDGEASEVSPCTATTLTPADGGQGTVWGDDALGSPDELSASPAPAPSAIAADAQQREEAKVEVVEGEEEEAMSETQGRTSAVSELKSLGSSTVDLSVCSASEETTSCDDASQRQEEVEEREDAVMALLSLQRMPSSEHLPLKVDVPPPSVDEPPPPITGSKRRAVSPAAGEFASQRYSPVPKADGEARFFCK